MVNVFIALGKGELGKEIEKYLKDYGLFVELDGRPLQFVQGDGRRIFRPMQSKDVPWYVAGRADYGITGEDLVTEYALGNGGSIKVLERLGFGKGDLVVFAREDTEKAELKRVPVVAFPYFYGNTVRKGMAEQYLRNAFGEYNALAVNGSTEGFVADGTADLGFDFTTYFTRPENERGRTTISANRLKIVERIMPTEAVVISKNMPGFNEQSYEKMLSMHGLAWKKTGGLIPAIVQDAETGEVLMEAYANQNALQKTIDTGLATFYSRSRQELWTKGMTSGNTMAMVEILYDCDGDALLYRVKPKGPACHTGERTCFYRSLWKI